MLDSYAILSRFLEKDIPIMVELFDLACFIQSIRLG